MKAQIMRLGRTVRHEYLRLISVACIFIFAVLPLMPGIPAMKVTAGQWIRFCDNNKKTSRLAARLLLPLQTAYPILLLLS